MQYAVVVDSCLFVLLIVGLTNPKYIHSHRNLGSIYNEGHFYILLELVNRAPQIVCSAHVLAETSNLLRQVTKLNKTKIMLEFQKLLQSADRFNECCIDSSQVSRSTHFIRLGLTDAAITSLDPNNVQIFTVDHDLHIEASRKGFDVTNLLPYFFDE